VTDVLTQLLEHLQKAEQERQLNVQQIIHTRQHYLVYLCGMISISFQSVGYSQDHRRVSINTVSVTVGSVLDRFSFIKLQFSWFKI
jgi:hypothetical protein